MPNLTGLDIEGQSDLNPIRIPHIMAKEFEYLVEAIYNMFVECAFPVLSS